MTKKDDSQERLASVGHTPSPWRISPTGQSIWAGEQDEPSFVRICARPEGKVSQKEINDWPFNARLIAAAPDLLEACRRALAASIEGKVKDVVDAEELCRAAIKKAGEK